MRQLPQWMLVGVSDEFVYGFEGRSRRHAPGALVFRLPRRDLQVSVSRRVNVRTLTLTSPQMHTTIELEGHALADHPQQECHRRTPLMLPTSIRLARVEPLGLPARRAQTRRITLSHSEFRF